MANAQCAKKHCPKNRSELINLIKDEKIHLGEIDTSEVEDMDFLFSAGNAQWCDGVKDTKLNAKCLNNAGKRKDFSGIESNETKIVKCKE